MSTLNVGLLDILGRPYILDNCTAFVKQKNYKQDRDYYITDMLYLLVNSIYGKQAELPRFADFFKETEKEPQRTEEAVKTQIKGKMKLLFKEN